MTTLPLQGRLVNIQNYSLNTIASVMKKFLRKIPGGIFGADNEAAIFKIIKMEDKADQMKAVHGLHLLRTLLHLDDVEDGGLVLRTEYSAWDLAEKLLHDAGDGVEGVVLHVDESPLHMGG